MSRIIKEIDKLRFKDLSLPVKALIVLFVLFLLYAIDPQAVNKEISSFQNRSYHDYVKCGYNLKDIALYLEFNRADKGSYPKDIVELVPGYLKENLICPAAKRDVYSENYRVYNNYDNPELSRFIIFCSAKEHGDRRKLIKTSYPE